MQHAFVPPDAAACADLFRGGPLGEAAVVPAAGGTLLLNALPGDRLLELWQEARDLVPVTGRWPVATTGWGGEPWIGDPPPDAVEECDRAAESDPWPVLAEWVDDLPWSQEEVADVLQHRFPAAPDLAARTAAELDWPTTEPVFDAWLYEALLADPALRGQVDVGYLQGTRTWHPMPEFSLVLLPTPKGYLSPAWLDFHGAPTREHGAALAGAEQEWEVRWGAELVASWGTMLQFIVTRPPQDPRDAWAVAGQLKAVGGSLQMFQHELALALPGSDAWFIHDRP